MSDASVTTTQELQAHLKRLVGDRSLSKPEALREAQNYITMQLRQANWTVDQQAFRWMGRQFDNVVATLPGESAARLILGAHFDTVKGSPGADDNASGVAVLLEAARLLAQQPLQCTVECVAFNLEEMDMVGSRFHADALKKTTTKILGMYSLEMVGYTSEAPNSQKLPLELRGRYPSTGNFLSVIGNRRSQGLLQQTMEGLRAVDGLRAEQLIVPLNGWLLPATRLSDHAPFWDAGYPALLLTDTAFLRNPHYHQPTDTLETLDLEFMAQVCAGVIAGVQSVSRKA